MESQFLQILSVFLLGGCFVFIILVLIPLINQIIKTSSQLESTATTLDKILNNELNALLNKGKKVLDEIEDTTLLVKDKLTYIPAKATRLAFWGGSGYLVRSLLFWTLKKTRWMLSRAGKKEPFKDG